MVGRQGRAVYINCGQEEEKSSNRKGKSKDMPPVTYFFQPCATFHSSTTSK
jgi:hypothetical protein